MWGLRWLVTATQGEGGRVRYPDDAVCPEIGPVDPELAPDVARLLVSLADLTELPAPVARSLSAGAVAPGREVDAQGSPARARVAPVKAGGLPLRDQLADTPGQAAWIAPRMTGRPPRGPLAR